MKTYRICSCCIMDTVADPDIRFNEEGRCTYCIKYDHLSKTRLFSEEEGQKKLAALVDQIKKNPKNGIYDCLLGVSGGVDSTYTAVLLKKLGLNPLLVHLDNSWNSEAAVRNINNMAQKLGLDLYTHVINWEEFKDVQLSFLKASVVDIELVSDYAIVACLYNVAAEKNIRYIISGHNFATEAIMPAAWVHAKSDLKNILAIHRKFGKVKLKTFPLMGYFKKAWYVQRKKIKVIPILNFTDYNKEAAKKIMKAELDWQDYGVKHGESVFTKFYQNYILPQKFSIDKRKAHLSSLICSGQMNRETALEEISKPLYNPLELAGDIDYIIKKFGLSKQAFDEIMNTAPRSHLDFPSYVTGAYKREVYWSQKLKPVTKYIKRLLKIQVENNYV